MASATSNSFFDFNNRHICLTDKHCSDLQGFELSKV
nr:MAG TPA: hypothetical protein [Bacteriophage sp.]